MISNRIVQKNNVTTSGATTNLWGWGVNNRNQIKIGAGGGISSPIMTDKIKDWYQISNGGGFACGIEKVTYKLFCWGSNYYGQLGDGTTTLRSSPVAVGNDQWRKVACGYDHVLAIRRTTSDALFSWGRNDLGQLGDTTTNNRSSPVQIGNSQYCWHDVAAGFKFSLAIQKYQCFYSAGYLKSWGKNDYYQLGLGNTTSYSSPQQVGGSRYWTQVSAGLQHSLGINETNFYRLYAWGRNNYGQLGDGTYTDRTSPYLTYTFPYVIYQVEASSENSAVVTNSSRKLYTFGRNTNGQLGNGTTTTYTTPQYIRNEAFQFQFTSNDVAYQVSPPSPIGQGDTTAFLIDSAGALWSWGSGGGYIKGDGTTTNTSTPSQVGSATNWSKLSNNGGAASTATMFALKV